MTKEGLVSRAVYKGENETYIVIVESAQAVEDWKKDSSIPLTQVVGAFQVYVGQGAQGILDRPSKQQLENEFGTKNEDDIVKKIISEGKVETSKATSHKFTEQNQSNGSGGAGGR
ncbi:Putative uncharacterized protein [Taphrina deformans PYCC 5710]|uniref:Ribosome maturation protein SDO1/SBDS N-terminal domain-containing protein n=1 Tax=Taphrina deformans (strain PYCC 5710 / ATCC 11124 / CBS 356.35 / IMI 108563 / JCM 9778 / NBRC 8474) TaxID=1097556 RepID=R4XDB9_TAPDE|nr:Putative uncharacterized protein [Taphrina deformans PYCC 5710]|eukprot:CCG83605.1 Putative uncharacterized protein [Taphrina deformans PYCC 5710]